MKKFAIVTTNGNPYQDPNTGYVYDVDYAFDYDTSTTYWKGSYQKAGDYVQIMFREPITLETIRVVSDRDILKYGEVQISKDGKTFESLQALQGIADETITLAQATAIMGVRIQATQANDAAWWRLNEVIINSQPIIDKKVLESELNREVNQSLYTTTSYQTYLDSKQLALAIYQKDDVKQTEINQAVEQLRQAYLSLAVLANKSELQKLTEIVIADDLYSQESYNNYLMALNTATELLKQDDISQSDIDEATWNLREAILKLDKLTVDKSILNQTIQKALSLDETLYTSQTYQNLQTILITSQNIYQNAKVTQQEIDDATKALKDAIAALELIEPEVTVNKTALTIAVEVAGKVTDEDLANVVPVVVTEFKAALANADAILKDNSAFQEVVDAAFDRLAEVMWKLEFFKGDKTDLRKLADQIEGLNKADYSDVSWNAMVPVLDEAKGVLADANAMQDEVNKTYTKLVKAFLNLRLKPNKDLLEELINQALALNESEYTPETWALLQALLPEVKAVLANEEADYRMVEEAISSVKRGITGLEKKVEVAVKPGDTTVNATKTGDTSNLSQLGAVLMFAGIAIIALKKIKE